MVQKRPLCGIIKGLANEMAVANIARILSPLRKLIKVMVEYNRASKTRSICAPNKNDRKTTVCQWMFLLTDELIAQDA